MKILVMTIGAGNSAALETSLYEPALLSLGGFERAVLLPSSDTLVYAEEIAKRAREAGISVAETDIVPLEPFAEDNADKCFDHFYRVIATLRAETGRVDDDIHIDFTRGTKGMSAALVLAAAMHGLTHHRYLGGPRDSVTNLVQAGKTEVKEFETQEAQTVRALELAKAFMREGRYASVGPLLKPLSWYKGFDRTARGQEANWVKTNAEFFAAWDRFDYGKAASLQLGPTPMGWKAFAPSEELIKWVAALAAPLPLTDFKEMAIYCRRLACDLFASARRRFAHGECEDALLRCYRVLELVGQVRLFSYGYDAGEIPGKDKQAIAFNEAVRSGTLRDKYTLAYTNNRRNFTAARMSGAHFLEYLKDSFGSELAQFDDGPGLQAARRNQSVLVHGWSGDLQPSELGVLLKRTEALLIKEHSKAAERLGLLIPAWAA